MLIEKRDFDTWKVLVTEKAQSFVRHASSVTIDQGSRLAWNDYMLLKVMPYIKNKRVAVDIGASYGFVSNELATEFQTVFSSEIIVDVRECLRINMRFNSNVEILNYGFSNFSGKQKIFFYPNATGHSTRRDIPRDEFKVERFVRACPVRPLDIVMKDRNDIDFVKIDVEGSELKVLEGATELLTRCEPVLLIELLRHDIDNAFKIIEFLNKYNYVYVEKFKDDYLFIKR